MNPIDLSLYGAGGSIGQHCPASDPKFWGGGLLNPIEPQFCRGGPLNPPGGGGCIEPHSLIHMGLWTL